MSTSSLDILIKARDEASSTIKKVEGSTSHMASNTTKSTSTMSKGFSSAGSHLKGLLAVGAGAVGVAGISMMATKGIEAYSKLDDAIDRVRFAVQKVGGTEKDVSGLTSWAEDFGYATGQSTGDVLGLTGKLMAMGQGALKALGPSGAMSAVEGLTSGLTDMASVTGKSASMLLRSLGPAILNTPAKALPMLEKLGAVTGPRIGEAAALAATTNDQINALVKSGAVSKDYANSVKGMTAAQRAQNLTTFEGASIQQKFGGAAAKATDPIDKLHIMLERVEETIGHGLFIGLNWLFKIAMPAVRAWFQRTMTAGKPIFALFASAASGVLPALKQAWDQLSPALAALWTALKPIAIVLAVVIGLALLGALKVLPYLIKAVAFLEFILIKLEAIILRGVVKAFTMLWHGAELAWRHLKPFFANFARGFAILKGVITRAVHVYVAIWMGLYNGIHAALSKAWTFITGIWGRITGFVGGLGNKLGAAAKGMWDWLGTGIKGAINAVITAINWLITQLDKIQIHVPSVGVGPLHTPAFDWNGLNLSGITPLAKGGVVYRPTLALVGESGPEAVVPLGHGGGKLAISLDRHRFVQSSDFDVKFRGY
jgi:hypothetical protein